MNINARIDTFGYNALDVAEYVVKYESEHGYLINNLKLQKILYFLQAQFVVFAGKSLFEEDLIAWDIGPVVNSVWLEYRRFGGASIFIHPKNYRNEYIANEHRKMIDEFLEYIRPYSSTQLVDICHGQKPWQNARIRWNNVISLDELKDFFTEEESEDETENKQ